MDIVSHSRHPWQPPFCPNPNCTYHSKLTSGWPYKKIGFYLRLTSPKRIQRFLCLACRRSFSRQTFSTTYWLKRPDLLQAIFMKAVGGMANRQIARDLRCAPATVDLQLARLGRHCLLLHRHLCRDYTPRGDLVIDGFESFEFSQYFPMHHHLAVEASTGFFIHFTDSELRRKGRMTAYQKRRRALLEASLGRPDPKAIEKDVAELLSVVVGGLRAVTIRSDDHPAYRRAIRRVEGCWIRQEVTGGRARRTRGNALFEVNLLDLLIRHSQANHRRQTLAWSKRRQASAERLAVLLVWRNYVKRRWEKGAWETPGMLVGITSRPWMPEEILGRRLFVTQQALPERWEQYYWRRVRTRALPINRLHELKLAM
jgi:transposase-like protein